MTIRSEIEAAQQRWLVLTVYEKFEQLVVLALIGMIAIVVVTAVWNLALKIFVSLIVAGTFDPTEHAVFQVIFGMVFTVIIALEFKRSLLVIAERHESIVQVRSVILLAMLAILRKLIIFDLGTTNAGQLLGLSAAIFALGLVYWIVLEDKRKAKPISG